MCWTFISLSLHPISAARIQHSNSARNTPSAQCCMHTALAGSRRHPMYGGLQGLLCSLLHACLAGADAKPSMSVERFPFIPALSGSTPNAAGAGALLLLSVGSRTICKSHHPRPLQISSIESGQHLHEVTHETSRVVLLIGNFSKVGDWHSGPST